VQWKTKAKKRSTEGKKKLKRERSETHVPYLLVLINSKQVTPPKRKKNKLKSTIHFSYLP
jgi:hypothetical protein